MDLTLSMTIAGLFAGLCQFAAHHLMRERQYKTCVPRYIVGSAIVLICFTGGLLADSAQPPVIALAYLYAASLIGTRIGYATDPQPRRKPTAEELERWAAPVASEHRDGSDDGD